MKQDTIGKKQPVHSLQASVERGSWITIALIIVTCLFLWSSSGLGRVSNWIPQLILLATLVLLLLQLAKEILVETQGSLSAGSDGDTKKGGMLPALAWMVMMLLFVWLSGLIIGLTLFCFAYLRWHAGERWQISGVLALGLGLGLQLLFGALMRVTLYKGVLLPVLI